MSNEQVKETKPRKQKKKGLARWIVAAAASVVVLAVILVAVVNSRAQAAYASYVYASDITVLSYAEMKNSISATGTVESADKTNVYSTMSYTVADIAVEVGDQVQQGDVLLELDRESIEKQIKEKELSLEATKASTGQSVKTAKDTYDNFKEGMRDGTNSSLISANSSVQTAYDNWQKAIKTYDEYKLSLNLGDSSAVISAENAVNSAQNALNSAHDQYMNAKAAWEKAVEAVGNVPTYDIPALQDAYNKAQADADVAYLIYQEKLEISAANPDDAGLRDEAVLAAEKLQEANKDKNDAQAILTLAQQSNQQALEADRDAKLSVYKSAQTALNSAQQTYDNAYASYKATLRSSDNTLEDYAKNIETSYKSYQTALASRTAAEVAADNQLEAYKNSLATAQIGASQDLGEYQLEQMYKDLEKASITAPVSGTVTAVYATVGASGSGLLFVIEDTDNLIVETTVKGYDVGTVQEGMDVEIRCDATGDEVHGGIIELIAPTSLKNASGATDTTKDVLFETKVRVSSANTGLRIGMSVRLQYVVEQEDSVLQVPYSSVYQNAEGQNCVLVVDSSDGTNGTIRELPVNVDMENDISMAISGDGLAEGLRILSNPDSYLGQIGKNITLTDQQRASTGGTTMPFMMQMGN